MSDDRSAPALLRAVGLMPDGPVAWGRPARQGGTGVYLVEFADPVDRVHLDLSVIGKWLERVPELRLDGVRPTSRDLLARMVSFWLPTQRVIYIAGETKSIGGRLNAIAKTVPGDRKPSSAALWLHFLHDTVGLRTWWAETNAPEETELLLLEAFAEGVPDGERGALPDPNVVLPWAVLRSPDGTRKVTGITNPLLPEVKAAAPKPITRIVKLPPAEADGARDEAKRGRRPAPGRGTGRIASAAAYAAQGSPRKMVEPVYLSPEGFARIQDEVNTLIAERPAVIKRIATAREHGDLKENSEYHAAREEGGFLEGRINALQAKLKVAVVVAPTVRGVGIETGSKVRVEHDGEEQVVTIVSAAEANIREGRISNSSPVGGALIGRKVGDEVEIVTPAGRLSYRILEVD